MSHKAYVSTLAVLVLLLVGGGSTQGPSSDLLARFQQVINAINNGNFKRLSQLVNALDDMDLAALAASYGSLTSTQIGDTVGSQDFKNMLTSVNRNKVVDIVSLLNSASIAKISIISYNAKVWALLDNVNFFDIIYRIDWSAINNVLQIQSVPYIFQVIDKVFTAVGLQGPCSNPDPSCENGGRCIMKSDTQTRCKCTRNFRGRYCRHVRCFDSTSQCSAQFHAKYMYCLNCGQWLDCRTDKPRAIYTCPADTPHFSRLEERCINNSTVCRKIPLLPPSPPPTPA